MLQVLILSFSLSADAFAASVAKGAGFPRLPFRQKAGIALGFGVFEAVTPLFGFFLATWFAAEIAAVDHWIAFAILGGLGMRMLWKSSRPAAVSGYPSRVTWSVVAATAAGTSMDAAAVGVTLAVVGDNLALTLVTIGVVTFLMALIGLRLGGIAGERGGRCAEFLGGLGLIAIGTNILATHLA